MKKAEIEKPIEGKNMPAITLAICVPEDVTCAICGEPFTTDNGLNFFIKGTETLV